MRGLGYGGEVIEGGFFRLEKCSTMNAAVFIFGKILT